MSPLFCWWREKAAPPNEGERRQHRAKKKREKVPPKGKGDQAAPAKRSGKAATHNRREEGISTTRKNPPDDPTTRCGEKHNHKKNTSRKQCDKAKLDPCSMMPLFERQQPIQVAMSGLLGELFVCVMNVFCCFCMLIAVRGSWMIQHGCQ